MQYIQLLSPRVNNLLEAGPAGPSRSPSVSSSSAASCPSLETAVAPSPPPESPCPHDPPPASPSVSCLLDNDAASIEEIEDAAIDEDVFDSLVKEEEEEGGNLLSDLFENQQVTDSATDETQEGSQGIDNEDVEAKEMLSNISSPSANITSDLTSCASEIQRDFSEEEMSQHLPQEQMLDQLPDKWKNSAVGGEVPLVQTMNRFQEPDSSCDSQAETDNEVQVLDRFQHHGSSTHPYQSLVVESTPTDWSVSPFSGARLDSFLETEKLSLLSTAIARLSPYIRRDTETEPDGLAVLRNFDSFATRLHPIDFCYLQPQLLPAVNCLAEKVNPQAEKT